MGALDRRRIAACFMLVALGSGCGDDLFRSPPISEALYTPIDWTLDVNHQANTIAYLHLGSALMEPGIYVKAIHRDSVATPLLPYDPVRHDPSELRFSPDGTKVALVRNGYYDIEVMELSTGHRRRVTFTDGNAKSPDWDPSSRFLVYERPFLEYDKPDTNAGLFIVDTETLQDRPLLHGGLATWGGWPRWSPDSATIVFSYGSPTHIYTIRVDGGDRVERTAGHDTYSEDPVWATNDASLVLFESWGPKRREDRQTRALSLPGGAVRSWLPDIRPGGGRCVINRNTGEFITSAPDPTGRYLVLYAQKLDDVAGGTRRQVTSYVPAQYQGTTK